MHTDERAVVDCPPPTQFSVWFTWHNCAAVGAPRHQWRPSKVLCVSVCVGGGGGVTMRGM
jgi:hypothetical protein